MSEQAPSSSADRGTNGAGLSTSVECVVCDTVWPSDTDDLPQVYFRSGKSLFSSYRVFSLPPTSRYFHTMCTKYLLINR